MDLKAKIDQLRTHLDELEIRKMKTHEEIKETKKRISKYETVLKHAEEIDGVEEKPLI